VTAAGTVMLATVLAFFAIVGSVAAMLLWAVSL
jgi:hypothetical protein